MYGEDPIKIPQPTVPRSTERSFPFGDRTLIIYREQWEREQWEEGLPVWTLKVFDNLDNLTNSIELDQREYEILMDALARSAQP